MRKTKHRSLASVAADSMIAYNLTAFSKCWRCRSASAHNILIL
jgi:hypothetical protein